MQPIVQLSLDLTSVDEALRLAEIGVRAGVDWLEAGTPLILAEGLRSVEVLHARFPDHPVVADLKTMDGGYLEAEMMAKAGASMVVVMGVAHPATIRAVVRAARDYGIQVMGDIMASPDKVACAQMLEANGVDYIIVHTGFDERHEIAGLSPLDDLPAITAAVSIPVQAVGGLTVEQLQHLPALGAPLVVIGAPLAIADTGFVAGGPDAQLEAVLREVCTLVHGQRAPGAGPIAETT
ncbi:MAG TPA: orotidine 5'-phosphate decarboxylase / HUMPS family protein [Chloroflexia bacterium]|nr:orotidine 5'-phosphate decarboxylase / HUMPS family protein [Chloroflexia bacterium]